MTMAGLRIKEGVAMEPVNADFLLVKVDDSTYDIVIFAEESVLRAFQEVYSAFYVEKSVFQDKSVAIISDFPNQSHAETWKQYWIEAFADPQNACQSCVTVNKLFQLIEQGRISL